MDTSADRATPPVIDVVVLTWNDGTLLDRAVTSALTSEGVQVEVVVVDNGSDPPATPPADPRVTLIRNTRNRGVAPARNQGVGRGRAPLVCLLDSDARLRRDTLGRLAAAMAPDVALAAPVFEGQDPEHSAGAAPGFARKLARGLGLTDRYRVAGDRDGGVWDVDFAIGACQLIRREAFEAVGGLDDTIFYGPEDVDLCLRLRRAGWRVVQVADAVCHHPPRRRNRRLLSRRGLAHAREVLRHLRRQRRAVQAVRS